MRTYPCAGGSTTSPGPGWLRRDLEEAKREIATWPQHIRPYLERGRGFPEPQEAV